MFGKQNQFGTVTGFRVRVKDEREADRNHLIESTVEVPLTQELADEIMPAMARDLFQQSKGEWIPKPEIQAAKFDLKPAMQVMTVRTHPDLDPVFNVQGVTLRKIHAKKTDANTWILVFTATWVLGNDTEAVAMIRALKSGVYITLAQQQPSLLDEGQAPDNGKTATTDSTGNVTNITEGKKKRGRPRKQSPEAEGAAQRAEGAARTAGGDDAGGGEPSAADEGAAEADEGKDE